MRRAKNLFSILVSDANITEAILTVNRTHRFAHGKANKTALWVELTMEERIKDLRRIITDGFEGKKPREIRRYDYAAQKWRDIKEPALWPDQYIHHMVIQALQPVMMRGMDYWCCGSIKGRGAQRGIRGIKKWINNDPKHTKYCAELDIRHFYDSLTREAVMARIHQLVKDPQMIRVVEQLISGGIMIGAYYSQWFANTVLQPLDHIIREKLKIPHYVRYMDNLTLFSGNKRELRKAVKEIEKWLDGIGLKLKDNWQIFRTAYTKKTEAKRKTWTERQKEIRKPRLPCAMGLRYGKGYTLLRKRTFPADEAAAFKGNQAAEGRKTYRLQDGRRIAFAAGPVQAF